MRKTFATGILLVLVLAVAWLLVPVTGRDRSDPPPTAPAESEESLARLHIGPAVLRVEIANTPRAHARGLSGRTELPEDRGMLFIFPSSTPQTFWMKDTLISLDLIWVREGVVIGFTTDVQPEPGVPDGQLRRYRSPGAVDWVVETSAGWVAAHRLHVGMPVRLEQP